MPEHPSAPHHLVEEATARARRHGRHLGRRARLAAAPSCRALQRHPHQPDPGVLGGDRRAHRGQRRRGVHQRPHARSGRYRGVLHGRRAVQRDTAACRDAHRPITLVERFGRARLNSPNDVVVASDGAIWFTDPAYGIKRPVEGHAGDEEYGDRYVFRYDEKADALTPVVIDVEVPDGFARHPLYVADSSLSPPIPTPPIRRDRAATRSTCTTSSRAGTRRTGGPWSRSPPGSPTGSGSTWKDGSGARACPACRCSPRTASACWTSPCPEDREPVLRRGRRPHPLHRGVLEPVPDPHHHDGCEHGRTGQGEPLTGRLGPSRNSWGAWRPWASALVPPAQHAQRLEGDPLRRLALGHVDVERPLRAGPSAGATCRRSAAPRAPWRPPPPSGDHDGPPDGSAPAPACRVDVARRVQEVVDPRAQQLLGAEPPGQMPLQQLGQARAGWP